MGVPEGAGISVPVWLSRLPLMGSIRPPNREDSLYRPGRGQYQLPLVRLTAALRWRSSSASSAAYFFSASFSCLLTWASVSASSLASAAYWL